MQQVIPAEMTQEIAAQVLGESVVNATFDNAMMNPAAMNHGGRGVHVGNLRHLVHCSMP